jgi:hypothetical protein
MVRVHTSDGKPRAPENVVPLGTGRSMARPNIVHFRRDARRPHPALAHALGLSARLVSSDEIAMLFELGMAG